LSRNISIFVVAMDLSYAVAWLVDKIA